MCRHKWWLQYRHGHTTPPNRSAQVGIRVHKILEDYHRLHADINREEVLTIGGHTYNVGLTAHRMALHAPEQGTVELVEHRHEFTIGGIQYVAIVDWETPEWLGDYKTTSDLRWALDEDTIRTDVQAVLSSRRRDENHGLWWIYGTTKAKPEARSLQVQWTRADTARRYLDVVLPLAEATLADWSLPAEQPLEKNLSSCKMYGGCPFQNTDLCVVTNGQKLRSLMAKQSIAEKLSERIAAKRAELNDEKPGPAPSAVGPALCAATASARVGPVQEAGTADRSAGADLINPPVTATTAEPVNAEPEPNPKKRGRPRKASEPASLDVEPPLRDALEAVGAAALRTGATARGPVASDPRTAQRGVAESARQPINTLYVDCLPLMARDNVLHAHVLIAKAANEVQADAHVPHVRLIDFKGGALLAAQLSSDLQEMPPGFDLCVNSRTPESRECMQVLYSLSQQIVIGL